MRTGCAEACEGNYCVHATKFRPLQLQHRFNYQTTGFRPPLLLTSHFSWRFIERV